MTNADNSGYWLNKGAKRRMTLCWVAPASCPAPDWCCLSGTGFICLPSVLRAHTPKQEAIRANVST